ncbi:ImmA/IrrE family metallo-endopeptidase [Streptomyces sp. A5-4]|uniref:ImmA/IrrE family metallo-endopeptidase n=1 Tax=Streptomyces sp. A5-4 TaxID=3384771 RepID=UPI003DA8648E
MTRSDPRRPAQNGDGVTEANAKGLGSPTERGLTSPTPPPKPHECVSSAQPHPGPRHLLAVEMHNWNHAFALAPLTFAQAGCNCRGAEGAGTGTNEGADTARPRRAAALSRRTTRRWRDLLDGFAIYRDTRRTARAIRKDVGLAGVCDIDDLIELVSARRGRPITVRAEPLPVSAGCGSSRHFDSIVVDSGASELSQLHAKLHELGHLLYDAPSRGIVGSAEAHKPLDPDLAKQLFPGLKADEVSAFFKRSHYDTTQERRVEIFATVMLERHLLLRGSANSVTSIFTHRSAGV